MTSLQTGAVASATANEPHTASMSLRQRATLFVLTGEMCLLYVPTALWLWSRWTMSVWHNAHGMFVPPIVAYLSWQELKDHPELGDDPGSRWGFAFLVPALFMNALDAGMHTQLLSAASLLVALPGLSLLFLGVHRTRRIAFPLCFMAFALPIPLGMTETAHLFLRHVTVWATTAVLPLLHITVYTEGTTLHLARGALQVADACSGFSTVYAALAVATLTAHLTSSIPRRILVLAAAAPIAMVSNVVRVLVLVLLVQREGAPVLETFLHPLSGMITFALSLPLIFWLGGTSRPPVARA